MAEPVLDQPRVVAGIGQGIAAGVAQHVGMDPKRQLGALATAVPALRSDLSGRLSTLGAISTSRA